MKPRPRLERLFDRAAVSELLSGYASLWSELESLCLVDERGHCVSGPTALPQAEFSRLWDAVLGGDPYFAQARDTGAWPIRSNGETYGMLVATGILPASMDPIILPLVFTLRTLIGEGVARRAVAQETLDLYRELNVLYRIGDTLGAGLELDQVCRRVLDESIKLIKSQRGAVLLVDHSINGQRSTARTLSLLAQTGLDALPEHAVYQLVSLAMNVVRSGEPVIINQFQPEGLSKTPVVCAPLRFQDDILGVVLLTDKTHGGEFTAADEKLLFALAAQAANSIENARLLDNVKKQRDEIANIKSHMDNIFASIASGVITTDKDDIVTSYNRAAESILCIPAGGALNRSYDQVLACLLETSLPKLLQEVKHRGRKYLNYEISTDHPARGHVDLSVSLTRLRGTSEDPLGVTIVMDDVTEKKKIDRERRMVRHYLPPELIDSLPGNLDELKLQGERQVITAFFADIRGFTSFSEIHNPETVVEVINRYFGMAAQAVREHHGIIDKYLGDAVMALFNTPLLRTGNHAWDAVQAAWQLKHAIARYHKEVEPEKQMNFGVGISTGEAVVGNVGTIDRMEYTAIGDGVNVAKRLQEIAAAGQIVMSRSTWERVKDRVHAKPLPAVTLKGRRTTSEVFELVAVLHSAEQPLSSTVE
jgi:adenylate cyclase